MKLGRWALISNGGAIGGVLLTVVLSFMMRNVWALAIGYCCEYAFRVILSFILCPGLPSFSIDWRATKQLLIFSRGMFGLALLNLIINRADIFVLGRLYPLAALGIYTMAVSLANTPSSFLSSLMAQTLLPAFSSIHQESDRVNRILMEITKWLLLGMPATVFVCLTAPILLKVAYGSRYIAAAGPLSVASAVVFLTVLNVAPSCVLFAKGLPGVHRESVVATAITMLVAVYPASKFFGPTGAQFAALLASLVGYLLQIIYVHRTTQLSLLRYGWAFAVPAAASSVMLAFVLLCRLMGLASRPAFDIAVCTVGCLIAYAICIIANLRASGRRLDSTDSQATEPVVIS
jgi:O-antigen/teichoic acid export membrane protein